MTTTTTVRARVELLGSLTYEGKGRSWERGKPQILTSLSEINHYRAKSEFAVTMLKTEAAPEAKKVAKPAAGKKPAKAAPEPVEDDEDEDSGDDEDEELDEGDADEDADSEGDEDEDDAEAKPLYKKADLEKHSKASLMELAKSDFPQLKLDVTDSKPNLIKALLKAQIAAQSGA